MMISQERRAEAVALYASGLSLRSAAAATGCSTISVLRWVRAAGVTVRYPGRPLIVDPKPSTLRRRWRNSVLTGAAPT